MMFIRFQFIVCVMAVVFDCDNCNVETELPERRYNESGNNFCSRECYNEFRKQNTAVECECNYCGGTFEKPQSVVNRGGGKYCSRECKDKSQEKDHPVKICQECGKKFEVYPSQERYKENKYCSKDCYGKSNINRKTVECQYCSKEVEKTEYKANESDKNFCNHKCQGKYQSERWKGNEHPAWKGGHPEFYGKNWKQKRKKTLKRDSYKCQMCGTTPKKLGHDLDVHHIKPIRIFDEPEDANFLENLITVCRECHREIEGKVISPEQIKKESSPSVK